jgi:hypothetical protein
LVSDHASAALGIAEVASEGMELKPDGIGGEHAA